MWIVTYLWPVVKKKLWVTMVKVSQVVFRYGFKNIAPMGDDG